MITVVGEALIDLVNVEGRRFDALPGGSPLNTAVGIRRLGEPTAVMVRLGRDAFGRMLRRHAEASGLDLRAAAPADEPTTLAVVTVDEVGHADYDFYVEGTADWQWTDAELAALPEQTAILHTGSLASWIAPGEGAIAALVDRVRADVLISYDPNIRPRLLGTPAQARPLIERSVAAAHVVKASEEDIGWLYPDRTPPQVAADWSASGPDLVVITLGGDGMIAQTAGGLRVRRAAVPITLADTMGAGDAFTAGLLTALTRRQLDHPGAAADLTAERLAEILDEAGLVAALTCERPGADPPTAEEFAAARHRLPG
ncbi:MAG TPA: carbohydrate kinase [Mycobacteriales bacterium]|nr:carbohydrate kinase [Mycobacteriales bacterium]